MRQYIFQILCMLFCCFEIGTSYVVQAGLDLLMFTRAKIESMPYLILNS